MFSNLFGPRSLEIARSDLLAHVNSYFFISVNLEYYLATVTTSFQSFTDSITSWLYKPSVPTSIKLSLSFLSSLIRFKL